MTTVDWIIPDRPASSLSYLLQETTYFLLQEDSGKIIIDEFGWTDRGTIPPAAVWTDRTGTSDTWTPRPVITAV